MIKIVFYKASEVLVYSINFTFVSPVKAHFHMISVFSVSCGHWGYNYSSHQIGVLALQHQGATMQRGKEDAAPGNLLPYTLTMINFARYDLLPYNISFVFSFFYDKQT